MDCNLLDAVINTCTTKSYKGFKRTGWITPLANIDPTSVDIDGVTVKFGLQSGMFYEIYDDSANPFQGSFPTVEETANHGYKRFTGNVKFPVKPLSPEYAAIVTALSKNQQFVVILEQEEKGTADDSRYIVHGLQGGLYCTTPTYEMANDSVWEISMMEYNIDPPALFLYDTDAAGTAALKTLLIDYEWVQSYITIGGAVNIGVTNATILPIVFIHPDGDIEHGTEGEGSSLTAISQATGTCYILVPKTAIALSLFLDSASSFEGAITIIGNYSLDFTNCSLLTQVNAEKSKAIAGTYSGLTAAGVKLILDNAYSLYLTGVGDGTIDLTGTTAIDDGDISLVHADSYSALAGEMAIAGWTITYETV